MRVALIPTPDLRIQSGSGLYGAQQARALAAAGVDVTLFALASAEIPGVRLELAPVPIPHPIEQDLAAPPERYLISVAALAGRLAARHAERSFHLVHGLYATFTGYAACFAGDLLGIPAIVSCFGRDLNWTGETHPVERRLAARCVARADGIVCSSEEVLSRASALGLTAPATVLPMGVDEDRFTLGPVAASERLARHPGDFIVMSVLSSMLPDKGLETIVAGCIPLLERLPQARLVLVGLPFDAGTGCINRASGLIAARGLGEKVHFLGEVPHAEVPACLAGADAYIDARTSANFSSSLLEAVAAGLPVLVSRTASCQLAGWHSQGVFPDGDTATLSAKLLALAADPYEGRALRTAARDWWSRHRDAFGFSGTTSRLVKFYWSVLAGRSGQS